MLTKYNKSIEKIAMVLLSFMPAEQEIRNLRETMLKYEENTVWQLYLWKQEDAFVGLLGIKMEEHTFTVHHASVDPTYRRGGIGHAMVKKVQELQEPRALQSSFETKDFLTKCWETTHHF